MCVRGSEQQQTKNRTKKKLELSRKRNVLSEKGNVRKYLREYVKYYPVSQIS